MNLKMAGPEISPKKGGVTGKVAPLSSSRHSDGRRNYLGEPLGLGNENKGGT